MTFISYAQNFEDVLLWRALKHIQHGFYLDIGAQDPVIDSVSRSLYDAGWRGAHVEATPAYARMLRDDRPDETVVEAAVSDRPGIMTFYEFPETGLSTGDKSIADTHVASGIAVNSTTVPCITLSDLLDSFGERDIHWMKVDVEGMEPKVLAGWGDHAARPWILVVESTVPRSPERNHGLWIHEVISRGYTEVFFDGLSRYFVSEQHGELASAFDAPANVFDGFALSGTATGEFCIVVNQALSDRTKSIELMTEQVTALQLERADLIDANRDQQASHSRAVRIMRREQALLIKALAESEAVHATALHSEQSRRQALEALLEQQKKSYDVVTFQLHSFQRSWAWRIGRALGLLARPITPDDDLAYDCVRAAGEQDKMQPNPLPPEDGPLALSDFNGLHDAEFVWQAYRRLLKRDPDPDGQQHYLARIRAGYSKSEVVAALARSGEAKAAGTRVIGARRYRAAMAICSIPILGRFIEGILFLFYAREFTREVRALENYAYRLKVHVDKLT